MDWRLNIGTGCREAKEGVGVGNIGVKMRDKDK